MFHTLIESFIRMLRVEKRYSPHTLKSYRNDLEQFAAYLQQDYPEACEDISLIQHHQIRSWLVAIKEQQHDVAPTTLNRKISTLNSFYKYLMREGIAGKNPTRKLHSIKIPERLPVYLKETETEHLLETISFGTDFQGHTNRLICELLYGTGMRRQELVDLKENDVEWGLLQLRVLGKGNKERLLPLSTELLEQLQHYIAAKRTLPAFSTTSLLVLKNGKPLNANYVYKVVKDHLGQVATLKKKSPHVLRHTFATHLLNNGANIQAIKDLLGHASLAATQVYTHNSITQLKNIHDQFHPRSQKMPPDEHREQP